MAGRVRCQRAIAPALPADTTVLPAKIVDPNWQFPGSAKFGRDYLATVWSGLNGHFACVGSRQGQ